MGVYVKSLTQLLESWDKIEADADEKKQIFAFLLYYTSRKTSTITSLTILMKLARWLEEVARYS